VRNCGATLLKTQGDNMNEFGELKKVNIREVWNTEDMHFTPWLAKNIEKLGEVLGIELELIEKEAEVGDFSLDILAKDTGRNKNVIIENQFGNTDHKHLGQLLTYAAGYDAGAIIWIAEELREEHRRTIDWLNESVNEEIEFYGVVIEILKIDNSKPAYNFKLVAFPNKWSKSTYKSSTISSKAESYRSFFQLLIDTLRTKYKFTEASKGQPQSWYSFTSGVKGILYSASFALGSRVRAEIYIDKGDKDVNEKIFDELFQQKEYIENKFGQHFEWEKLEDKRACRVAIYRQGNIDCDEDLKNEILTWCIENLLKIKEVFILDQKIKSILK